ncbi:cell division protein FtsQ/DivIB [Nonlabens sp. YIK11]|uniref:cell division protein FtsQ/DivIB n=1 Tax=Nonlabens sp. YIK11 TaxID=1453349 RepID=UPI0006DC0EFA|nr:cell division protein FtsQ/DivIB [Nonlabens sp. YIK11]
MKRIFNLLILPVILVGILALYSFANKRHYNREIVDINISFTDYSDPFISEDNVNKLLIQKEDSVDNRLVEKLDLNKSETRLVADPMIRAAEVSVDLNGKLHVMVEQRRPLARLLGGLTVYLDSDNSMMPLSSEHTALVPVVLGFKPEFQEELYEFLVYLENDELLHAAVTQIVLDSKGNATLMLRSNDMRLKLGKLDKLHSKMTNFKAMLAKVEKDKAVDQIKAMDLRFDGQVIVVKKEE